jgi:hypothetical protein
MEKAAAYAGTLQEQNVATSNNNRLIVTLIYSFGPSWGAILCASHGDAPTYSCDNGGLLERPS